MSIFLARLKFAVLSNVAILLVLVFKKGLYFFAHCFSYGIDSYPCCIVIIYYFNFGIIYFFVSNEANFNMIMFLDRR